MVQMETPLACPSPKPLLLLTPAPAPIARLLSPPALIFTGLGQGIEVWEGVQALGWTGTSLWQCLLHGGPQEFCVLPLPAGTAPTTPICHTSWSMRAQSQHLGQWQ